MVALVIVVALLVLLFVFRGWIRKSILPNQVSYFAKQSLHEAYKRSNESAKLPLEELKITLRPDVVTQCHLFTAEMFHTTVTCRNSSGDELELYDDYLHFFKQNSLKVEQKILNQGWTKVWNAQQPINELFNNPTNDVSVGVNYEKPYGKNKCTLSLFYNAYEKNPRRLSYSLSCDRIIHYLGSPPD